MKTGASLQRKLTSGRLGLHYRNAEALPLSHRPVLAALCALIALSEVAGVFVPDRAVDPGETVVRVLAREMQYTGAKAEAEIATTLERLQGLQFIQIDPVSGAVALMLPSKPGAPTADAAIDAMTPRQLTSAFNGLMSLGKPKGGESADTYADRLALHKASQTRLIKQHVGDRAVGEDPDAYTKRVLKFFASRKAPAVRQITMSLPITGGLPPGAAPVEVPLAHSMRAQIAIVGSDLGSGLGSGLGYKTGVFVTQIQPELGFSAEPSLAVAAAKEAESLSSSSAAMARPAAAREPGPEPRPEPTPEPGGHLAPQPSTAWAAPIEVVCEAAEELATMAATLHNFDAAKTAEAPAHMQKLLASWTVDEIEHAIRSTTTQIRSAGYFATAMERARRDLRRQNGIAAGPEVTKPAEQARMLDNPAWLEHREAAYLRKVCQAMDDDDARQRAYWLAHWQNHQPTAYAIVARRYPEIRELGRRTG